MEFSQPANGIRMQDRLAAYMMLIGNKVFCYVESIGIILLGVSLGARGSR